MPAKLRHCDVFAEPYGSLVIFHDGATSSNWPPQDAAFARLVTECGFTNPIEYVRHHDLSHAFLAEKMFDKPSPVLWAAAHGSTATEFLYEERWVWYWQRFMYAAGHPPLEEVWWWWGNEFHDLWNALDELGS